MTVEQLCEHLSLSAISLPQPGREVTGCYSGDLLSWVMGRAQGGDVWITIMSNVNIVAVGALADVAAILLAEGVTLDEQVIATANAKGVNILASEQSAYALSVRLSTVL